MAIDFNRIGQKAIDLLGDSIRAQGHYFTGKLVRGFETRFKPAEVQIWGDFYAKFLERGVKRSRIPYRKGKRRGGVSKYIQALIAYFQAKGKGSMSKNLAFATANTHVKEGMPTSASRRFSSTGKRTGFIEEALKKSDQIFKVAIDEKKREYEVSIGNLIKAVK
jgi:hypothetical protein